MDICTALSFCTGDHYFGRTLDLEYHYNENIVVVPRRYPLTMRCLPSLDNHYAIIGAAHIEDEYPLFYDAVNEKGLGIAGLNFPGNACYHPEADGRDNVAPFELMPWVLGQCTCVDEAVELIKRINIADISYSHALPLTPLHWMLADRDRSVVVEPMAAGTVIHENPVGVMTNNPTFDIQMHNLNSFMSLSPDQPENRFSQRIDLVPFSRGMGALGLPGDMSSPSRFVRAAFTAHNSVCGREEEESVGQFFHILGSVNQTRGCVRVEEGYVATVYTSCCNTERGVYYYTTYENSCITGVDMHRENLDGKCLASYPMTFQQHVVMQN